MGRMKQPRVTVYVPWKFEQGSTPGTGKFVRGKRVELVAVENFPHTPWAIGVDQTDGSLIYGKEHDE